VDVRGPALTVAVGLVSGLLSGQFGIGGGLVTTPAIRLLLGYPALIALGTPLPVILPTAVAGAVSYWRRGLIDVRAGLVIGAVGSVFSVLGALATRLVGGSALMIATGALIVWVAIDMALHTARGTVEVPPAEVGASEADPAEAHAPAQAAVAFPAAPDATPASATAPTTFWRLAVIGVATGLYSGLLGLGGGFVVVPALVRWLRFPLKRALGTSLVAVAVLAIPGSITHYALGHIDLGLAALLIVGTVPGALVGARLTAAARERTVAIAFSAVLGATGLVLAGAEAWRLLVR
jgi:uncharacterized membrane protein YfcA